MKKGLLLLPFYTLGTASAQNQEAFSVASDKIGDGYYSSATDDTVLDANAKDRKRRDVYPHEETVYTNVRGQVANVVPMTDEARKLVLDKHNEWRNMAAGADLPWGAPYTDLNGNTVYLRD